MASKNTAEVIINGKVLKISGYESPEYLHRVASYINKKMEELARTEGYRRQPADQKQILLIMNMADDYFKAKELADKFTAELDIKEKEMYGLKHDLIEAQLEKEACDRKFKEKIESMENNYSDDNELLLMEIQELQKKIVKLETEANERENHNNDNKIIKLRQ